MILLARLAVDLSVQAHGLGAWLLADAMKRSLAAAELLGIRALLVHALDDRARAFYLRHGLLPGPTNERHLMILVKDIRTALDRAT
ncbi:MAG TPA: GNAT family N-acetyltransferase [Solirubrobacteraceae bacterium]|nr:GNAT family N-acetyltransferase [Solirubrobacteraceae bacterium]